ncbi:hypothetical protein ECDEC14D_3446 [Escherichia coli DEC14D]|nr:hypothetical protein ECDEC14D_3446 [Escherichia coli DEC14D]
MIVLNNHLLNRLALLMMGFIPTKNGVVVLKNMMPVSSK